MEEEKSYYDKLGEKLQDVAAALGETFDHVLIIASSGSPNTESKSNMWAAGTGNYYAQYGLAKDWIIQMEMRTKVAQQNMIDEEMLGDE